MDDKVVVSLTTVHETDSLIIQQLGRNLWINGKESRLSPLEKQLLVHLIQHAGKTLSHKRLKAHLYPDGRKVDPKMIAILVSKLRRKLRGAASLLETVRGEGFVWKT